MISNFVEINIINTHWFWKSIFLSYSIRNFVFVKILALFIIFNKYSVKGLWNIFVLFFHIVLLLILKVKSLLIIYFEINFVIFILIFMKLSAKKLVCSIHVKLWKSSFFRCSLILLMLEFFVLFLFLTLFNHWFLGKIMNPNSILELNKRLIVEILFVDKRFHETFRIHFVFIPMNSFLILIFFNKRIKSIFLIDEISNLFCIHKCIELVSYLSLIFRKDTHC